MCDPADLDVGLQPLTVRAEGKHHALNVGPKLSEAGEQSGAAGGFAGGDRADGAGGRQGADRAVCFEQPEVIPSAGLLDQANAGPRRSVGPDQGLRMNRSCASGQLRAVPDLPVGYGQHDIAVVAVESRDQEL